ncbi:hypothetical protein [Chryseobacterium sp. ON_d1]|uniref:hypothetical protein n=1 Tax=Chryseobacterium sp. ON_d1 TaxID=2583211 RepID=UPI001158CFC7|nr:hypothetical protein [Chryseobacterium sp. ON_d1]GEJ44027.1 hypothetical protein CRS_06350 [Chryseobacterium sp. ON_d1]
MGLKHIVELNEKELMEIICKHFGLQKDHSIIRISPVAADYGQGTSTTVIVESKESIVSLGNAIRGMAK